MRGWIFSGGPPCQGFSGIGHRRTHKLEKHEIPTNHLFHEMIRVIEKLQPTVFLFENVVGILSGRWTEDGMPGEIFRDVWEGFSHIEGYDVQPTILHAYGFGVPQNRPRVMIMGVKKFLVGETVIEFDVDRVRKYGGCEQWGLFPTWDESEKITDPIDFSPILILSWVMISDMGKSRNYNQNFWEMALNQWGGQKFWQL